jgi:hypothetical protein
MLRQNDWEIEDWKCHLEFRHMVEDGSHKGECIEHGGMVVIFNNCFHYFWLHPKTIIIKSSVCYQSFPFSIFCKHEIGNYWKWHTFTKSSNLNENPKILKLCALLYEMILSYGLQFKIPKGKLVVFENNFSTTYHIP